MGSEEKVYVLVLCYLDENRMDIGGNVFPEDGFITAKEFTNEIDIQCGLYGILWGKRENLFYEKVEGNWAVVKVEVDIDFIIVDSYYNKVKFRSGMVVCSGGIEKAGEFLLEYIRRISVEIKEEKIIGTKMWMQKHRRKISCCL
jgi:hypothetical protein